MEDSLGRDIIGLLLKHEQQHKDSNCRKYTNPFLIIQVRDALEESGCGLSNEQEELISSWADNCWEM